MVSWDNFFGVFAPVVLGLTFLASLTGKLRDREGFRRAIGAFRIVPGAGVRPLVPVLIAAEAVVVVLLVVNGRFGSVGAAALLAAYTTALVMVLSRRMKVACHCFGVTPLPVSWIDVARNVLLLAVAAAGMVAHGRPPASDALLIALLAAIVAVVVTNLANVVSTALVVPGGE